MKRFLAFFMSFLLWGGVTVQAEEIEEPQSLYAQAAVLMDADSERVLFEKNGDEILANASTTKILTCIIALENGNLEDVVSVSKNAVEQPRVHLGMQEGEQFVLRDLLYSLMLESHNDSAVAIAEHLAGSVEAFADLMNQKAKELECENTYFITPNGLDAVDETGSHSTTATDLARIMSYCITESPMKEAFLMLTGTASYSFSNVAGSRSFSCANRNSFLTMMDGAISGKTGFTGKAGYCYVGAVERDGRTFVVSLLACGWPNNKTYKWKDTLKLMEYAINNYTYRDVYEEIDLPKLKVEDGISRDGSIFGDAFVGLEVDDNGTDSLDALLRKDESVEVDVEYDKKIIAPVEKDAKVGKVIYRLNGDTLKEYPIVVSENVQKRDFSWIFYKISEMYFCGL